MPNKMERFTGNARAILTLTQIAAEEFGNHLIKPVHLLLAMTRAEDTDAFLALEDNDIIETKLLPFIKVKQPPQAENAASDITVELSDGIKKTLELSVDSSRRRGYYFIGTAHLLIGLMRLDSEVIAAILNHFDVDRENIIKQAEYYLEDNDSFERKLSESQLLLFQEMKHQQNRITCWIFFVVCSVSRVNVKMMSDRIVH